MGAICSRGVDSQYDLVGALHCDYHDDVNKKVPDKQPLPIPWHFIRSSYFMSQIWVLEECWMEKSINCWLIRDRLLFFVFLFCQAGGSNYTINKTGYRLVWATLKSIASSAILDL